MENGYMYKRITMPIQTKDVDINDYIRPSTVLDYFQDIAGIHANLLGLGADTMLDMGLLWIIIGERFDVVSRVPSYGEEITIVSWPKNQDKLFMEREYEIRDIHNELLITGISLWVLVNKDTHKLERADKAKFPGLYYENTNYNEVTKRKLNLCPKDIINEYDYKVCLTDYDHNKHLNNARYLDIIYNMYDKDYNLLFNSCEIAFHHEALQNEIIHVKHFKDGIYDCYCGYVGDELSFEVKMVLKEITNE